MTFDRDEERALLDEWFATTSFDVLPDEDVPDLDPEDDEAAGGEFVGWQRAEFRWKGNNNRWKNYKRPLATTDTAGGLPGALGDSGPMPDGPDPKLAADLLASSAPWTKKQATWYATHAAPRGAPQLHDGGLHTTPLSIREYAERDLLDASLRVHPDDVGLRATPNGNSLERRVSRATQTTQFIVRDRDGRTCTVTVEPSRPDVNGVMTRASVTDEQAALIGDAVLHSAKHGPLAGDDIRTVKVRVVDARTAAVEAKSNAAVAYVALGSNARDWNRENGVAEVTFVGEYPSSAGLKNAAGRTDRSTGTFWQMKGTMPVQQHHHPTTGYAVHEMGHVWEARRHGGQGAPSEPRLVDLHRRFSAKSSRSGMSEYGKTHVSEMVAESFMEFVLSEGTTSVPGVRAVAKLAGWTFETAGS